MSYNMWTDLVHHEFELSWVEKIEWFLNVSQIELESLNIQVKHVWARLKVSWSNALLVFHINFHNFFIIISYYL